jgi:hypothetical protein
MKAKTEALAVLAVDAVAQLQLVGELEFNPNNQANLDNPNTDLEIQADTTMLVVEMIEQLEAVVLVLLDNRYLKVAMVDKENHTQSLVHQLDMPEAVVVVDIKDKVLVV